MLSLFPAFLIGLVGSLHCAGMCGPLMLSLPTVGKTRVSFVASRVVYNLGRITTYCFLGALFGAIGLTFALAGFQRWASIVAGIAILIGLVGSSRYALKSPVTKGIQIGRKALGTLLARRTMGSLFLLGMLNGFLPCGLVYVACAGATAEGSIVSGLAYMFAFGLGTVPMMLSIGLVGRLFRSGLCFRFQRLIPATLATVGFLLILRGMSLGIPYLSPVLTAHGASCPACHR